MELNEEELLRATALQTAKSILQARQRAEEELVRAKKALERSVSLMQATLEATSNGILVVDGDGKIANFNQNFAKMWNLPDAILRGGDHRALVKIVAEQLVEPEGFLQSTHETYASAPPETFEIIQFKDGRIYERYSKLQRIGDKIVGRVWSHSDITARVRAQETLRDEARVLELLNQTGTAIASTLDLQTLIQAVTDAATELSGAKFGAFFYNTTDEKGEAYLLYTLSGAPREAFEKFGHPRATPLFGPTFRGEGPIRSDDVLKDPRYGQWGPHHGMPKGHLPVRSYLAVPVASRSGEVVGGLFFGHPEPGVFDERAERIVGSIAAQAAIAMDNARLYQTAQRERERAERETRMKDEFLATLSHELRTPLNAILGWAAILRDSKDPKDILEALAVIERNARAQTRIIEDLLDMSRIISGKVRLDVQRVDLLQVIRAAIDSVDPTAAAKEIRITSVLDPLAGPVSGDPARLQQILWNLLTNAVKFTSRGGRIHVVLERVNSHLEVSVSDNGRGIAPEFLPHVFDRFRQADASSTREHGGLGLGLAIVKHLAELHGGAVRAKSAGLGHGATFCLILPLAAANHYSDTPRRHPKADDLDGAIDETPDLTGVRVLIVDDEADARHLVKSILTRAGVEAILASSAEEGLKCLQETKPDVLISDIGMPGEDGYAFIRNVRHLSEAAKDTPAIALTAFARSEDRRRAIMAGFQMYIAKPIEPAELVAMIANLAHRTT
jgi:signal transduction histidine kinase/PAS domain-containing protein/ActR/RegA family two-component response regulator